jgi:hypothetical protein
VSIRLDLEHIGDETQKARLVVSRAWDAVLLANKPQVHGNDDLLDI